MFFDVGVEENKRWFYPVSAFIISAGISVMQIWTIFYPYVQDHFNLDTVTTVVLASTFTGIGGMVFGPIIAGLIVDKYGPKIPFILAILFVALGYYTVSEIFSSDIWASVLSFWFAGSFFIGLGQGLYAGTYATVVAKWFPEKPGTVTGFGVAGVFTAPIIYSPIVAFMIRSHGFNKSVFFLLAGIAIVILMVATVTWKSPSHDLASKILKNKTFKKEKTEAHVSRDFTFKEAFKDVQFWVLFVCFICSSFAFMLFVQNASLIIIEGLESSMGIEYARGVIVPLFLTIAGVGGLIGGFAWGFVIDKLGGPWKTLPVIYFSTGILIILFYLSYRSVVLIIIIGFLLYLGLNGEPTAHYASVSYVFGRKYLGKIMTVLQAFSVGVGIAVGPFVGAYIKDITGGYFWAIMLAVLFRIAAGVSALIGLRISKRRERLEISN
jgi:MFS transporter, OFA family, oxalate/formate antiporter